MARGKWFRKKKANPEDMEHTIDIEVQEPAVHSSIEQPCQEPIMVSTLSETEKEEPITEYRETLYSRDAERPVATSQTEKKPLKRTSWENAKTIEQNVDLIRKKRESTKATSHQSVEEKVDRLLTKKKYKT